MEFWINALQMKFLYEKKKKNFSNENILNEFSLESYSKWSPETPQDIWHIKIKTQFKVKIKNHHQIMTGFMSRDDSCIKDDKSNQKLPMSLHSHRPQLN